MPRGAKCTDSRNANRHLSVFREFHGVANQIEQDLAQPSCICAQTIGQAGFDHIGQFQAFAARLRDHQLDGLFAQPGHVEVTVDQLQFASLQRREIKNIVDEIEQVLRRVPGQRDVAAGNGRQGGGSQQVQRSDHAVEWRAQLMAHGGGKLCLEMGQTQCFFTGQAQCQLALVQHGHHAIEGMCHIGDIARAGQLGANPGLTLFRTPHRVSQLHQWLRHALGQLAGYQQKKRRKGQSDRHVQCKLCQQCAAQRRFGQHHPDVANGLAFGNLCFKRGIALGHADRGDKLPGLAIFCIQKCRC